MDKFRVETIASTPQPQQVVWAAMHQDYSEDLVYDRRDRFPDEAKAGELIVKHLLAGNRGHYGCYDELTEVLTACGWLNWSKVQKWHNLAAFDLNTQTIKFEVPSALQKYQHHGDVYCLAGQQLDTVVTLDHRMLVKKRRKNGSWTNPYFEYAADVFGKPRRYLKSGYLEDSERHSWTNPWNIPAKQFAMLVGFFVGDGMKPKPANQIRFRLRLVDKIDFLYSLDIPVEAKAGDRYVINLPDIGKWFLDKCYDSDGEKCLPSGYLQLSSLEVEGLLTGLQKSDGNVLNKNWRYASTSTNLLDQIQALVHINNLSGNWSLAHKQNQKHKPGYYLHISDRISPRVEINSKRSPSYQESIKNYSGYVYCATVSTGALIIRRNRKVMVSGNCLEHPQITLNVGYFPHSMMQQIRTHRVGVSFDVQCLAADTEITFVNAGGGLRKIKIAELYDLWVNGEKAVRERKIKGRQGELPGKYRRDCKKRLQKMRLRVLNEETKIFETSHLKDVICSGVQPVYRLTLEDGKTLDCTTNHRLFTSEGWQTMREAVGLITAADNSVIATQKDCFVLCNGIAVAGNGLYRKPIIKPVDWNFKSKSPGRKLTAHPVKVIKVEYLGLQVTYDLEVSEPWHNFVANGVVVHNSFRYTGQRVIDVVEGKRELEDVFYLRPIGNYTNRQGKRYFYSEAQRSQDLDWCLKACELYAQRIGEGLSEEHARSIIPFDARQHFVVSCNARSLMHLLDLRWKKDAQLEAQKFCELLYLRFEEWMPAVAHWYRENRAKKAKLSP